MGDRIWTVLRVILITGAVALALASAADQPAAAPAANGGAGEPHPEAEPSGNPKNGTSAGPTAAGNGTTAANPPQMSAKLQAAGNGTSNSTMAPKGGKNGATSSVSVLSSVLVVGTSLMLIM